MNSVFATALAVGLLVVALGGYGDLLLRLRRLELGREEGAPWWFGYARDAANLAGCAALVGVFALGGFSGPESLVLGVVALFVAYVADAVGGWWLALRHTRAVTLVAALAVSSPALLAPAAVNTALQRLLVAAAPG